jgi:rhodanese-related sulfurtransferase
MKRLWIYLCALASLLPGIRAADKPASQATQPKAIQPSSPRNINPDEAEKLLKENRSVIVLDVRTPEEFVAGHIAGATNLNYYDPNFKTKIAALDKSKTYLLHCASGYRSAKVRDIMKNANFSKIYHLDGGLKAWQKAGKPVVR